jgi:uncharacterized membrane protein (DUF4010 family)
VPHWSTWLTPHHCRHHLGGGDCTHPPSSAGHCQLIHANAISHGKNGILFLHDNRRALGIGLVVGLEREWAHKEVGARTFAITTLLGVLASLLAWKVELVRFADALLVHEIRAAVPLALMSVVIYPLLPDRLVDPWALVNPRQAWVTAIAIASIGFLNYVLLRLYSMRGLYCAALLGGLVNSTAAVAELSASLKASERCPTTRAVALILLTTVAMFPRNLVILGLFARTALPTAFPPLATMAGAAMLFEWWQRDRPEAPMQPPRLASPLSLRRVLHFGLLFLAVDAAGSLAQRYLGNLGFLVVGLVGGLVSSASTTATAAAYPPRALSPPRRPRWLPSSPP